MTYLLTTWTLAPGAGGQAYVHGGGGGGVMVNGAGPESDQYHGQGYGGGGNGYGSYLYGLQGVILMELVPLE